jgi:DNA polymerase-3 subunit alpha (Gram-positive type)
MAKDYSKSLVESRFFFLGLLGVIFVGVAILNRDALLAPPGSREEARPDPLSLVDRQTPVSQVDLVVFDTETTGVDDMIHRLVELAAVKFRNGEVVETRSWLINPERYIPEEAVNVHGISPDMVADAPTFARMHGEFDAFVEGCVLMAHNAAFDIRFMRREYLRAEAPAPAVPVVDSLRLFRAWFPELSSYALANVARQLGVTGDEAFHRAQADSVYVGKIFYKTLAERGPDWTLADLFEAAGGATTL